MGAVYIKPVATAELQKRCLTNLRALTIEFDALTWKTGAVSARLFTATYKWVQMEAEGPATVKDGCVALGNTLQRTYKNVESWYYNGKYMADNDLDAEATCHRSVRAVYQVRRQLSEAEHDRCLALIRARKPYGDVSRVIQESAAVAASSGARRAETLSGRGELSERACRLQLVSVKAVLDRYYGAAVTVTVCVDGKEVMAER